MVVGLLFRLLFGVPLILSREVLQAIKDELDRESLATEESIKGRLQDLQLMLQEWQLSEAEYEETEARLIERLKKIRARVAEVNQ